MYRGNKCPQYCMIIYSVAFWCSGFGILFLGIWMLAEPRRSYILDLVDFSEDDPLLRFGCYFAIVSGITTLFVGFLACCGAIKGARCLLTGFVAFVIFIFFAELSIGVFALFYRDKQQPSTFEESKEKPNVPVTCCMSMRDATVRNPVPRSLARCQQPAQQCCGGIGPKDYYGGYWYLTNKERGTQSFVPFSCCKQAQAARAWAIQPIDPMCSIYPYYSQAFNNSVHTEGCHKKLQEWFDQQVIIFAVVGFSLAAFQIIGICLAIIMCRHIHGYSYVEMKSVNLVFVVFLFLFAMSFGNAYILKRHYEYPRSIRTIYGMVPDFSAMMRVYGKRSDTDLLLE
ncbi:hypothetical protein QR680_002089 [Steinernema hermaphroditum]|uniref:Tetraspanin n=1 Tax=Steinernema hermaphroditum TaxID=289476 RepID=A0AA39H392_9BILA|nr:hypothetical protein QR680_002089 [Steinernema hermaphroditum]